MIGWYAAGIVALGIALNMAIGLGLIRRWIHGNAAARTRRRQLIVDALEANDVHLYKQLRRP